MSGLTIAQEYVFTAGDYKSMRFNPMSADKKKPLLEQFPQLERFGSFQKLRGIYGKEVDSIVKYLLLCYDPMSPAFTQINDIFKRKSWCGLAADFAYNKSTNVFSEKYYKIMNCQQEAVNFAIIDLCSVFNRPDYMLLIVSYESFYRKQRIMSEDVIDEKKDVLTLEKTRGELYKQLMVLNNDLANLEEKFLNDRSPYLREDLYRIVNEEVYKKLGLTPERRAIDKGLMKDEV